MKAVAWVSPSRSPSHGEGGGGRTAPRLLTPGGWVPVSLGLPADVDESAPPARGGSAEHHCANLAGSFQCSCEAGYQLDEDRRGCTCESPPGPRDPVFLQHTGAPLPASQLDGPHLRPSHCGMGWGWVGGWEGLDRGPQAGVRGLSGPALAPPPTRGGLHSGTPRGPRQSRGLFCPHSRSTLRVPLASVGAGTAGADMARLQVLRAWSLLCPEVGSLLVTRVRRGTRVCRWGSGGGTEGQGESVPEEDRWRQGLSDAVLCPALELPELVLDGLPRAAPLHDNGAPGRAAPSLPRRLRWG